MLGHGKGMFYPHISLIKHSSLCVYLCFRNKYRRHDCRSWIKSIINELGKSGHEKLAFAIFIYRNMNWMIDVQTTKQQWPRKEEDNVSIMKASGRLGEWSLFCDEIILSITKSSRSLDPEDSLLSFCLSYVI